MSANNFRKVTLGNGLTLLGEPHALHRSTAIGFFVRTGSRDEQGRESGVSHFLEHMMFKGTPKRSALEISMELGNLGAQANAYTSEESTVYYSVVLPEYFPAMQELLCDMLRPALSKEDFDTEKKVILEEIALYQDRPTFFLHEHALRDYYGGHPSGNSVLGSVESISELSRDEMQRYFDRRYAPNNMVLVAAGNYDWDRFVSDAEKYCGSWRPAETPRLTPRHTPCEMYREYRKKDVQQVHVMLFTGGVSAQDEERYPMALLSTILGDSSGSRIYWELVASGLAESAGADNDEGDGTGMFSLSASTEPANLDQVSKRLRHIAATPLEFSDEDLQRAKAKLCSRVVLSGELPMGRLSAIGSEWHYRHAVTPLKEVIARLEAVTRKDIEMMISKFPLSPLAEFRLLPEDA